ncbi:hypothetical protein L0V05_02885 [Tabrizicola sp. J26]|uniref:hypothetical protein n=1 Tax=Alitabrizicola rongguiensis TaxID=2909234 RepID=UPI001F347286|nr:hypothetical protein [Tabrizicola rongguiensis]MCF1707755.1 hypothetical protein [Tabrizicola rongguiensis]
MSNLQTIMLLREQISELKVLISEAEKDEDIVGKLSFVRRLDSVSAELDDLLVSDAKVGEVVVLFDGAPVNGTIGIDAKFATNALNHFQAIVTRLFASKIPGPINARGKIRGSDLIGLDIRGVATGSFGFLLEERDAAQYSALKTPIRESLEEAAEILREFAQDDDDEFLIEVDDINPRIFMACAKFFRHLKSNSASFKATLPDRSYAFGLSDIDRAYKRISDTRVKIETFQWRGTLVGLSPIKRSFDFRKEGEDYIVSGNFSHQVSQDYLERIENRKGITLGGSFDAKIEVGTIKKPDGTTSISYTVTDLTEAEG